MTRVRVDAVKRIHLTYAGQTYRYDFERRRSAAYADYGEKLQFQDTNSRDTIPNCQIQGHNT